MATNLDTSAVVARGEAAGTIGRYRWVIVGLLFLAMVINYVDRQTISLLKPNLSKQFGWSETDYADLVFYFQLTYAIAYLAWGKIMDKIGARWGFGIAFLIELEALRGRDRLAGRQVTSFLRY